MNRRGFLATGAAAGLAFAGFPKRIGGSIRARRQSPLNVLVIVLDTVRGDRFGPAGAQVPEYDRIAARGVRFDRAWVHSSWSLPSQATILTGRYPHEHGADWPGLELSRTIPSLGSFFASHGYVTGAFSSNSSWVTPEYMNHGFHRFSAYSLEDHVRRTTLGRVGNAVARKVGLHEAGRGRKAPEVHEQFLDFIERYDERPFFAYLCHMDANQALHHARLNYPFWREPAPIHEAVQAYDRAITRLDSQMGELLDELQRRGILERTVVVVTADHGESFGSENPGDHDPSGHGTSLFPEQTRVPLAVITPDARYAGRVVGQTVGVKAIPATICRLMGLEHPFPGPPLPMDASVEAENQPEPAAVQTLNYGSYVANALVTDNRLFIRDLAADHTMLFDLAADPLCTRDLGAGHADASALRRRLERELSKGTWRAAI